MIIYKSTKDKFLSDVDSGEIYDIILEYFKAKLGRSVGENERHSWQNSWQHMFRVLTDSEIPSDSGVAIEYSIPQTSKRIDFILTGEDSVGVDNAVIVELKQWEQVQLTDKDGVVKTFIGRAVREMSHPSYQAWSYASLLNSFNQTVYEEKILLRPCAFLHNCEDDDNVKNEFYSEYIAKAPIFCQKDTGKLRSFIKSSIKSGDKTNLIQRIEKGKIRPSKSLADSLSSMLKGNPEFIMIDDQKIVYETAIALAKRATDKNKNVLIVEGGPGTGKSVVAVNLLVALTKIGKVSQYVTKNAAPRTVYQSKLTGTMRNTEISNLFVGSGSFTKCKPSSFDALIVDEAHRLNEKSGMFKNYGENQIKEIIVSSKFSAFFIDEDQRVTMHDIGEKEEIVKWAQKIGAAVHLLDLSSQFRCSGSDGYLAWLDNALQIRETANVTMKQTDFDFRIIGSPNELRDIIFEKNKLNNKARLVAGYCWDWVSKSNKKLNDIVIPEFDFEMKWNLASDGNLWILKPESVSEVGCIHTCQGLEVDYIGVIVGRDLIVRNGKVITDPTMRAKTDASIKGYKSLTEKDPKKGKLMVDRIIKNTYRTLMTRGMKGCYVYFIDKETEGFFKSRIEA